VSGTAPDRSRVGDLAFTCGLASLGLVVVLAFVPTLLYEPGEGAGQVLLIGLVALVPIFGLSLTALLAGVRAVGGARAGTAGDGRRARAAILLSIPGLLVTDLGILALVLVIVVTASGRA
jgi:hypothetical protein